MEASASPDKLIKVRQVTNVHANWSAQGTGEPGKFSFQLVLDNGAEEYLVMPAVLGAKVFLKLVEDSEVIYVDTERGVVIFNGVES